MSPWRVQRAFGRFAGAISCTTRMRGELWAARHHFNDPLIWCQWVLILPSTFQERGRLSIWSDILPWFLGSLLFCCCWVLVFLIYIMDCVWLAYFYSCALLLLVRDIFLTLQSGQKIPKMVPSPLVLFLSHLLLVCLCVLWLLLSGENHNGQSSQPENSVLEQNVFSSGFGVFIGDGKGVFSVQKVHFGNKMFFVKIISQLRTKTV